MRSCFPSRGELPGFFSILQIRYFGSTASTLALVHCFLTSGMAVHELAMSSHWGF